MADITFNIDIRQEVHGDSLDTGALASFTASAFDIEGEHGFVHTFDLAVFGGGEDFADIIKDFDVCGGVTSRCSSNRILWDVDNLGDIL